MRGRGRGSWADSATPSCPAWRTALAATAVPVPAATVRLARGVRNASPEAAVDCLGPHVEHPDRELGLAVRSALAAAGVEAAPLAADIEPGLRADAEHAARCLAALAAVTPAPLLERALRDELELLRERVLALLAVRHGAEAIHLVALGLASDAESRRSLAIEMLDVTLGARRGGTRLTGGADGPARPRSPACSSQSSLRMLRAIEPQRSPTSSTTPKGTGDRPGWRRARCTRRAGPDRSLHLAGPPRPPIRCFARPWNGPRAAPRSKGFAPPARYLSHATAHVLAELDLRPDPFVVDANRRMAEWWWRSHWC